VFSGDGILRISLEKAGILELLLGARVSHAARLASRVATRRALGGRAPPRGTVRSARTVDSRVAMNLSTIFPVTGGAENCRRRLRQRCALSSDAMTSQRRKSRTSLRGVG